MSSACRAQNSSVSQLSVPFNLTTFALSLLLVFRTNSSYSRWWEARMIWGAVVNLSRNFGRQVGRSGRAPGAGWSGTEGPAAILERTLCHSRLLVAAYQDLPLPKCLFAMSRRIRSSRHQIPRWRTWTCPPACPSQCMLWLPPEKARVAVRWMMASPYLLKCHLRFNADVRENVYHILLPGGTAGGRRRGRGMHRAGRALEAWGHLHSLVVQLGELAARSQVSQLPYQRPHLSARCLPENRRKSRALPAVFGALRLTARPCALHFMAPAPLSHTLSQSWSG